MDDPDPLVARIRNAGAIFAGHRAAETFGDYLAGSSHVLPTDGAARAWSGVSVFTFLKAISVQSVTREAAARLAGPAAALARLEGLEAHARAADARSRGECDGMTPRSRTPRPPGNPGACRRWTFRPRPMTRSRRDAIKLDANENPYAPLVEGALAAGVNRYPEPQPARLRAAWPRFMAWSRRTSSSRAARTMRSTC